jgi:hypothetical protein
MRLSRGQRSAGQCPESYPNLCICSHELWQLDHRGRPPKDGVSHKRQGDVRIMSSIAIVIFLKYNGNLLRIPQNPGLYLETTNKIFSDDSPMCIERSYLFVPGSIHPYGGTKHSVLSHRRAARCFMWFYTTFCWPTTRGCCVKGSTCTLC